MILKEIEARTLAAVHDRGLTEFSEISVDLLASPSTVKNTLASLEERGLVEAKGKFYQPTSRGKQIIFRIRNPRASRKRLWSFPWSKPESAEPVFVVDDQSHSEGQSIEELSNEIDRLVESIEGK